MSEPDKHRAYMVVRSYGSVEYPKEAFEELEAEVEQMLEEGWYLQGGVSVSHSSAGTVIISQALRYERTHT